MATKKWYASKAVYGIILVIVAGVGMYFIPDYTQFMNLVLIVGTALGIYGARVSTDDLTL